MAQRVMVTAGASGIGFAIAKAFAETGAKIQICDVDERALGEVRRMHPQIVATRVDLTAQSEIDEWFDRSLVELGGLDVLVNNAGTKGPTGYVEEIALDDWRQCLSVCLDSHFICARRAARMMKDQRSGSIINLSSTAGLFGYGLRTPYAAAKWAVIGFTKSLAIELGPYEVRANAICPGTVEGIRMDGLIKAEADRRGLTPDLVRKEYTQSQSIKRFVRPEEIADMCVFLASPMAKMVSGQTISVDGHTETFHVRQ